MTERTETFDWTRPPGGVARPWVLQVAWHAEDAHRDRQIALAPDQLVTLGRGLPTLGPGVLDHAGLSRSHARVRAEPTRLVVTDLGSKNGLRVDGVALAREGRASLAEGSVLSLPGLHLVARRGEVRARPTALGDRLVAWGDWLPALRELVRRWGEEDGPVLLLGDTGTGKLELARALHASRGRGRLVRINVRSWTAASWQRELFGHVRGAFTGAHASVDGALTHAGDGTVFFDEMGRMPRDAQEALLTLLDGDRTFRVLGDPREHRLRARVVAASDLPLDDPEHVEPALYHRLARFVAHLPALRQRREDILTIAASSGLAPEVLDDRAALALLLHPWPGNARELGNLAASARAAPDPVAAVLERLGEDVARSDEPATRACMPASEEQLDRLISTHGSIQSAADALNVSRQTIHRWRVRLRGAVE